MQRPRTSASSESPGKSFSRSPRGTCGKTLVAYQDALFDIKKLEDDAYQEYPEYDMDESNLVQVNSLEDGAFLISTYVRKSV